MDIRQVFQDCFFVIFLLYIHPGFSYSIDEDYDDGPATFRCPWIRNKLKNGRVRYRYKGRVAKFLCDSGYELAGKRSSTCVRGQWSNPVPVCVARGCSRVPSIPNGHVTEMYRGALLIYDCNPGYTLDGVASIHCDGRRWSSGPPYCAVAIEDPAMTCDFESPDLCGWSHDPSHEFDWKRNQFSTPSGHAGTGPSYDHTFGEKKGGYYLYLEASSPRKINDTARLFSPVYPELMTGGCFLFWYHMYGATTGGLRVYIKPESHVFDELSPKWEKFGDQGNAWIRGYVPIPSFVGNFQIVIEGIRGESYVGDSAIDDVSVTTSDCKSFENDTAVVEHTVAYSCRGRCREADSDSPCSCNDHCYETRGCCTDFLTFCFDGNETTVHSSDEILPEEISKTTMSVTTAKVTENELSSVSTKATNITKTPQVSTSTSSKTSIVTDLYTSTSSALMSSKSMPTSSELTTTASSVTKTSISDVKTFPNTMSTESNTTRRPMDTTVVTKPSKSTTSITTNVTSPGSTSVGLTSTGTTRSTPLASVSTTSSTVQTKMTTTSNMPVETTTNTTPLTETIATSTTPVLMTTISTKPTETSTSPIQSITNVTSTVTSEKTVTTSKKTTVIPTTISPSLNTKDGANITVFTTSLQNASASGSLATTVHVAQSTSTTTQSSPLPTTRSTTESTTRKTYNLRPRSSTSSVLQVSSTTPQSIQTITSTTPKRSFLTTNTPAKEAKTSRTLKITTEDRTEWHKSPVTTTFKILNTTTSILPTTVLTTKATPKTSTSGRYIKQSTIQYTPQIYVDSSKQTVSPYGRDSQTRTGTSNSNSISSNTSSVPIVISLIAIVLCIAGGIAYYLRKHRNKRQSKLSDDSEMRFLQENEYMEYSDASALDRIMNK